MKLNGVEGLHLDGGNTDVATDAERDDKPDGSEPRLGVTFGDVAAGAFRIAILVNFSQRRTFQFWEIFRHGELGWIDFVVDRFVDSFVGILEVVLIVGSLFLKNSCLVFLNARDTRLKLEPDSPLQVCRALFMLRPLIDIGLGRRKNKTLLIRPTLKFILNCFRPSSI